MKRHCHPDHVSVLPTETTADGYACDHSCGTGILPRLSHCAFLRVADAE
jgi:hypothetical protein